MPIIGSVKPRKLYVPSQGPLTSLLVSAWKRILFFHAVYLNLLRN